MSASLTADQVDVLPPQTRRTHRLWSIDIDPVTMAEAVARIRHWIEASQGDCKIVMTPNLDHVVQLYRRPELQSIYGVSSMTLADGWPLVTMSKMYGKALPQRVPGSDLLPELCSDFHSRTERIRLFLLGGKPGVPERAAKLIHARWPSAQVVGTLSPPFGFEHDDEANQLMRHQINNSRADVLIVGLGFPKQELWLSKHRSRLEVSVALGVGATIDFLAGEQTRAPKWVQAIKMEWFFRLVTDPKRLAPRYAQDAIYFPWICWKQREDRKEQRVARSEKRDVRSEK